MGPMSLSQRLDEFINNGTKPHKRLLKRLIPVAVSMLVVLHFGILVAILVRIPTP